MNLPDVVEAATWMQTRQRK